jgi:hypothetical protein
MNIAQYHYLEYCSEKTNLIYTAHFFGEYSAEKVDLLIKNHIIPDWAKRGGVEYDFVFDRTGNREIKLK